MLETINSYIRKFFNYCKRIYWHSRLGSFGKGSTIGKLVMISHPENIFIDEQVQIQQGVILRPSRNHKIEIGAESGINPYVSIYGKVKIGRWAMIAPHVMIAGGNHWSELNDKPMIKSRKSVNKGIIIEDDVWIGANSVIVDGVRIGRGAIIGAGSIVTNDVNENEIVVGTPAKKLRNR